MADLTLDALTADEPTAWSYVLIRKAFRSEDARIRLLQAARTVGVDKVGTTTVKYPFYRDLILADVRTDPAKLKERLIAEFDLLAKLVPDIDAIADSTRVAKP